MRTLHEEHGIGYRRLAKTYGISRTSVYNICNYVHRAQTAAGFKKLKG